MTMRLATAILAIAATLATGLLAGRPGLAEGTDAAIVLRQTATVSDDVIRLGDLFVGTVGNPETPVAKAPAPGTSAVLDYRFLAAIAKIHALPWRPTSVLDSVEVTRASQIVESAAIKAALVLALSEHGTDPDRLEIAFSGVYPSLTLPAEADPTLRVEQLNYDERTGRFTAVVAAPQKGPALAKQMIAGEAYELVEVPVLQRRQPGGQAIAEKDLEWIRLRADRVGANAITAVEDLIGRSSRRPLRAGEPIRTTDLRETFAVAKGSLVVVILQTSLVTATVQAKALENGAIGEIIRVANTKSNRVLTATVVDAGTVAVAANF
jgi:flagella basal body P-ring formation protein FlgA